MEELIKQQYDSLYEKSAEFRLFVDKMDKLSIEEIESLYELKTDIISYCSDLLKRQDIN